MTRRIGWLAAAGLLSLPIWGQTASSLATEESLDVFTEHPRLFLRPQRLRLLKREFERRSMRWLQFETLVAGRAPMPEPGFAYALYYQVAGDAEFGSQAVKWALGPAVDVRQLALVYDWCQDLLSPAQKKTLAAKIEKLAAAGARRESVAAIRDRVLAAVALTGDVPGIDRRVLGDVVNTWWKAKTAPALKAGKAVVMRDDSLPLLEILHAVRDSTNVEMRENAIAFFKDLPLMHLMSYYPAAYPAAENEFRIPAMSKLGEPDLTRAALSRAAELAMVAYDTNAPGSQVLQGWLMHDRFLMRGTFGIPYEYLWANPYQPGLSYYHVPLVYHDSLGRLFARSSWDDDASWVGYFEGAVQFFNEGRPTVMRPELSTEPLALPDSIIVWGQLTKAFTLTLADDEEIFLVGLKPGGKYVVEADGYEIIDRTADTGGIIAMRLEPKATTAVITREITPAVSGGR